MGYTTNNEETKVMAQYSYKERSRMAREKKKQEFISNLIAIVLGTLMMLGLAYAFIYALANEPFYAPVENPAYVNEYETPDVPKYIYPEE